MGRSAGGLGASSAGDATPQLTADDIAFKVSLSPNPSFLPSFFLSIRLQPGTHTLFFFSFSFPSTFLDRTAGLLTSAWDPTATRIPTVRAPRPPLHF